MRYILPMLLCTLGTTGLNVLQANGKKEGMLATLVVKVAVSNLLLCRIR